MKKTSERLQTVLKIAQLKQQQASQRLGEMTRDNLAAKQQQQQLRDYQQDYGQQFSKQITHQPLQASKAMNYLKFYSNLENAVTLQQERIVLAEDQINTFRREWQKIYSREKNMESLIERKQLEEEMELEKKLQREQDDRPKSSSFE